ncbi:MAG: protein kinase [Planctomycetes bacterium]|nr:protein kinase [Planctomycetota bacterium]
MSSEHRLEPRPPATPDAATRIDAPAGSVPAGSTPATDATIQGSCVEPRPSAPTDATLPADRPPDRAAPAPAPAATPAPLPPDGRPFGRYRLLAELGRGGMGVVWKAWDTDLQRIVALKQISAEGALAPAQIERFLREARLAAKLRHPHIIPVHDVGVHEGQPYFTAEFIEGAPLSERLHTGGAAVPARQAIAWVRAVGEALAQAHAQGVIHRDVKPGNILIDRDGRAWLMDFGLAKDVELTSGAGAPGGPATARAAELTQSGALLGTPAYMSPEQARGRAEAIGPASDQFSLGGTLYHLLTGRAPFAGETLYELLDAIARREPIPPRRLNPRLHRDLETICLKALEKDPARRYPSAGELAADLGRYLEGEAILARPQSVAERALRLLARQRRTVAGAALLVILLSAVGGALWHRDRRRMEAELARTQNENEARKLRALAANPAEVVAHNGIAWAAECLDQAIARAPRYAEAWLERGILHEWSGALKESEAAYRTAAEIDPTLLRARYRLAFLLFLEYRGRIHADDSPGSVDRHVESDREFAALAAAAPSAPYGRLAALTPAVLAWIDREEPLATMKERVRQLEELVQTEALPEARLLLAGVGGFLYHPIAVVRLSHAGGVRNLDGALRGLDLLLKEQPLDQVARMNAALLRFEMGDLLGAEADLRIVIRDAPDWLDPHEFLGRVLGAQGRAEEAEAALRYRLARRPGADVLLTLAAFLFTRHAYEEALRSCDEALALAPEQSDARFLRCVLLIVLGRTPEADRAYESAGLVKSFGFLRELRALEPELRKPQVKQVIEMIRRDLTEFEDILYLVPPVKAAVKAEFKLLALIPGAMEQLKKLAGPRATVRYEVDTLMRSFARFQREHERAEEVIDWLRQKAQIETNPRDALMLSEFAYKMGTDTQLQEQDTLYSLAQYLWKAGTLYRLGNNAAAERLLEQARLKDDTDARTHYGLATLHALRGDAAGCAYALRRARIFGWRNLDWVAVDADFAKVRDSALVRAALAGR